MAYEQIATVVKYTTVTVSDTTWSGSGPYTHSISVTGVTSSSMVDIQADSTTLDAMSSAGTTALYIVNNSGTCTLYAVGAAPTTTLSFQVSITEVVAAS